MARGSSRALTVLLGGDAKGLQRAFAQASVAAREYETQSGKTGRAAQQHAQLAERATGGLAKTVKRAAVAVAGLGLAYKGLEAAKNAISATETLAKSTEDLHRQFGFGIKQASAWGAVLQSRDVNPAAFTVGLTKLSKSFVAAHEGTKKSVESFKALGLGTKDINAAMKDLPGGLDEVLKRLSEMAPGAQKAAVMQDLLGRSSRSLIPLLRSGALGFQQQLQWAEKYGVTLDGHAIKSSKQMIIASQQLKFAQMGLQIQFTEKIAPALIKVEAAAAKVVRIFQDPNLTSDEKWKKVSDIIGGLSGKLEKAFEQAFPRIIDMAAQQAPHAASAFVTAWLRAGVWGKLFTLALISKKLGLFGTLGGIAADRWGGSFKKRAAVQAEQAAVAAAGEQGLLSAGVLSKFKTAGLVLGGITAASIIAKLTGIKDADPLAFLDPTNAGDPRPGHGDVQKKSNKISGIGPGGKVFITNPKNQPPTHHPHGRPHAHGGSVGARGASTGFANSGTQARAAGGTYSHAQLKGLAMSVGLDSQSAEIAAAIAQAESGGRSDATNHNTNGSIDVGLWQINSVHGYSTASMMNPQANAKAMAAISSGGTNWQPWVTYQTGAYQQYLTGGVAAPTGPGGVKLGSGTSVKVKAPPPPIAPKFPTGLRNAIRLEQHTFTGFQQQASDVDRRVSQFERRGDFRGAADLLGVKLTDEKRMRSSAKAALKGYQRELKILRHQMRTAPPGRRSKIAAAIKDVLSKIADLRGTVHDLGFDIGDTKLDIKDELDQAAQADAAGADTSGTDAATQAAADQAAADQALTDQIAGLRADVQEQTRVIAGTSGLTESEIRRAFVGMINGDLGGFAYPRTLTVGDGSRAKY